MGNRLASSTSPYLMQHAGNPVDWWEWEPAAFAEAVRRDVPLLLSVGYAACHWCHVMAHESFENPAIAAQLNAGYVAIKVDREERPDIDAVYMAATQALTGHGGWPMTVFLTPDGRPFYAGTYFPPTPRGGLPSFPQLLTAIGQAWAERRDAVEESAASITGSITEMNGSLPGIGADSTAGGVAATRSWSAALAEAAAGTLASFDPVRGGFGGAPKFPPAMSCEFLLRHHRRTGSAPALAAVSGTLEAMARGGLYDQLAGGFARYSVDADWVVPHFEKMLYDNALLLRVYAQHARLTGSALSERVCVQTAEFLLTSLRTPAGAFISSLDADTDGVEGLTYVWSPAELTEVLGDTDGRWAAALLSVTRPGSFEDGRSVLQLREDAADPQRWSQLRTRLAAARSVRPQPARDDKVILSWNGLAIAALAEAGANLRRPDWIAAAETAADFLFAVHLRGGRWRRSSRDDVVGSAAAVLSDHADLADGLLALHQATGQARQLRAARDVLDVALEHFADRAGGFFDTADDAEALVVRPREVTDGATPSGASALADGLLTYSALSGDGRYRDIAEAELARAQPVLLRYPRSAGRWLATAEAAEAGPLQIAVVGPVGPARDALLALARRRAPAGTVFAAGDGLDDRGLELLAQRSAIDGRPAAYVCRAFVCERPVGTVTELAELLR